MTTNFVEDSDCSDYSDKRKKDTSRPTRHDKAKSTASDRRIVHWSEDSVHSGENRRTFRPTRRKYGRSGDSEDSDDSGGSSDESKSHPGSRKRHSSRQRDTSDAEKERQDRRHRKSKDESSKRDPSSSSDYRSDRNSRKGSRRRKDKPSREPSDRDDESDRDGSPSRRRSRRSDSSSDGDYRTFSSARSSRRRSHSRRRHRDSIKVGYFDGRSSLDSFLVKFNAAARYNGWTEADKCAHLKTSLTGAAAALLWQLEDASFGEIIDKLTAHYGSKEVLELKCYRRKSSESLQEVAAELERLSALAYPGAMILMPDILAVDAFIEALDNTALLPSCRSENRHLFAILWLQR